MSHLHKNRLAQVNDVVPDRKTEEERDPLETANALNNATQITDVLPGARDDEDEPTADSINVDVDSSEESDDAATDPESLTKDQIRALLDDKEIEYSSKATKAELLELLATD